MKCKCARGQECKWNYINYVIGQECKWNDIKLYYRSGM